MISVREVRGMSTVMDAASEQLHQWYMHRTTPDIDVPSLYEFAREAWEVLEPGTPFVDGEHLRSICLHLEAVTDGRITRLLINMPPRHAKSTIVSVIWPVWTWLKKP